MLVFGALRRACPHQHSPDHNPVADRSVVNGFTLIELTMILVVVSVLAGMAVTSLSSFTSSRQNVAAARIRTALVFAQEWALGTGNDTWAAFDVGSDLVSLYVEDPGNPGKANRLTLTSPLTRSAMTLQLGDSGVGLASVSMGGTTEVQFDSSGIPYDTNGVILSADGTVGVTGGGTVRVTKNTGLVTVD